MALVKDKLFLGIVLPIIYILIWNFSAKWFLYDTSSNSYEFWSAIHLRSMYVAPLIAVLFFVLKTFEKDVTRATKIALIIICELILLGSAFFAFMGAIMSSFGTLDEKTRKTVEQFRTIDGYIILLFIVLTIILPLFIAIRLRFKS